jgi:hypothetical protein
MKIARPLRAPLVPSVRGYIFCQRRPMDRDVREFRDFDEFREQALAKFVLALANLQCFDLGL